VLLVESRVKSAGREFQAIGPATEKEMYDYCGVLMSLDRWR